MLSSSSPRHQTFFHPSSSSSSTNTSSLPTTLPDNSTIYYYPDSSSTSSDATSNSYQSSSKHLYSPSKRLKLENFNNYDVPSTYDCPPLIFPTAMPQAVHRPLINLHRASEPASPVTIATTLSNHSTPAHSPSRVTIVSDSSPADFSLYDDGYGTQDNQQKQQNSQPRYSSTGGHRFPYGLDQQWSEYPMGYPTNEQQNHFSPMPVYPTNNHTGYSQGQDDDGVPALSPSHCNTSRPSVSEIDMPVTPIPSPVNGDSRHCMQAPVTQAVPKLARTVSDAEQDELFNPGIAPGTVHAQSDSQSNNSQLPTLFQQAQTQHAMSRPSKQTLMMRDHSPFRANSPLHPARTQQEMAHAPARTSAFLGVGPYESARSRRERDMEREAAALREQMNKEYEEMQQTPKTISPKDACIEYHEIEGDGIQGSLFSSSQNDDSYSQSSALEVKSESDSDSYHGSVHDDESLDNGYDSMATSRRESDVNMSDYNMIYNGTQYGDHLQIPAYGWVDDGSGQESEASRLSDESYQLASVHHRPDDTRANDGAYSCTVPGCTMRFPTASKMSKHRREVHRHNTPMGRDAPGKSLLQGPSRCARINPTTGKPCNTVFSRPYDLTRHEDTIHNTARQKVRCEICNDEKTFSRQDALTRHKKVKHGIDK